MLRRWEQALGVQHPSRLRDRDLRQTRERGAFNWLAWGNSGMSARSMVRDVFLFPCAAAMLAAYADLVWLGNLSLVSAAGTGRIRALHLNSQRNFHGTVSGSWFRDLLIRFLMFIQIDGVSRQIDALLGTRRWTRTETQQSIKRTLCLYGGLLLDGKRNTRPKELTEQAQTTASRAVRKVRRGNTRVLHPAGAAMPR